MALNTEIVELLARSDARAIAFDPKGGSSVPLPEVFTAYAAGVLSGDSPLDEIEPESHGRAVIAFEHARRHGRGAATVTIVGETDSSWLEVYDLEKSHGCFVAVATPNRPGERERLESAELAARQSQYDLSVTGVIQAVSADFVKMFGWKPEAMIGKSSLDFIHPDDHEIGIIGWVELLENPGGQYRLRQRLQTAAGEWVWCELTETNLLDEPDAGYVRSEIVDVSREMAAQAALQRRERLLDRLSQALPTGVLQLDVDGTVEVRNDRWTELIGGPDGGLDALLERLIDPAPVEHAASAALRDGLDADLAVTFDDIGVCRFGELHLRPLVAEDVVTGLLLTLDDVTKLHTHQIELAERARRDPLTEVRNRLGIDELISDRLSPEVGERVDLTVLFLDLDRFKAINDTRGHIVGDQVLRSVAECIEGLLRSSDILGRLGGDEFLVILGPNTPGRQAEMLASRIREAVGSLASQFDGEVVDGVDDGINREVDRGIDIGVSIGIAKARDGDDFDSLIKRADAAMYEAKNRTKAGHSPADESASQFG